MDLSNLTDAQKDVLKRRRLARVELQTASEELVELKAACVDAKQKHDLARNNMAKIREEYIALFEQNNPPQS